MVRDAGIESGILWKGQLHKRILVDESGKLRAVQCPGTRENKILSMLRGERRDTYPSFS